MNKKALLIILIGIVFLFVAVRLFPKEPLSAKFSSSTAVYDSKGRLLRLTLSDDDKYRLWMPLNEISPILKEAFLLHEDRHFYRHFAFNPVSLMRAAYQTYITGGRRVGGSTITMQLARLIYGINSKSPAGKLIQIARAIQLELYYSKDEIFEAYLNLVPYGRNIEGVAAASFIYYNRHAGEVTLPEAVTMAVIPQSPARRSKGGQDLPAVARARHELFARWLENHPEDAKYDPLINMPLSVRGIADLPFDAPHMTDMVVACHPRERGDLVRLNALDSRFCGNDVTREITTTLDLDIQRTLERHVKAYISRNKQMGMNNASAILVDHRTMEVKALLGSADFFNVEIEGQVNGATAKRSPGSALKPFVYALGIEQGVIHPMTLLKDSPSPMSSFEPENFDGQFIGPVTAKEALIRSRNVPAIAVAGKLSGPNFYEFLKMAGISGLKSERHYGPSLVIGGGGEVTMEELAALYAALASKGILRPLRHVKGAAFQAGVRILSEEASFITLEMLKDNPRPDQRYNKEWTSDSLPVYWKTGTSYGFRDAWSVGIFGPYVLAVWIGNFNGEGNPSFVGARAATPLFFQIIDSIKAQQNGLAEPMRPFPENITKIEVCSVSGGLPGAFCKRKKETWFIPGRSPIKVCDIHREVVISDKSGLTACPPYSGGTHAEVYEFWPSDLLKIFQQAGIPRMTPPEVERNCSVTDASAKGLPPKITTPVVGLTYTIRSSSRSHETISFLATTDADVHEVFWFLNEGFIGRAKSGSPLYWSARPGRYVVRAVDDLGRSDARELKVAVVQ